MNTGERLRRGGERLSQDGAWVQRTLGVMADGSFASLADIHNDKACAYCSAGILRALGDDQRSAHTYLCLHLGTAGLSHWNDDKARTQAEVVEAFFSAADAWDKEQALKTLADEGQKCDGGAG